MARKTEENGYYGEDGFVWWLYLQGKNTTTARIVETVLRDLTNRRGIGHEFNGCDSEIKKEICDDLLKQIGIVVTAEPNPSESE